MNHKHRQIAAAAIVALVVAASIAARNGSALPNLESTAGSDSKPVTTEDEFADFVRDAIEKNARSANVDEWEASGYTAADVLANADARDDRKEAYTALCNVLCKTDDAGLALFQDVLSDPKTRTKLRCAPALAARLLTYWSAQRILLQDESRARHQNPALVSADKTTLASGEVRVDSGRGQQLVGSRSEGYLKDGEVAILLDGGPHPIVTREILDTLKAYGVHANFFNGAALSRRWPALLKAELAEGHVVGSHSQTRLAKIDIKTAEFEIAQARRIVSESADETIQNPFFRFPYGAPTEVLGAYLKQQHLTSFSGNVDSQDWKRPDPADLLHYELAELDRTRGGMLMLHDSREQTAIALPYLLDELRHRGWKTVFFAPR